MTGPGPGQHMDSARELIREGKFEDALQVLQTLDFSDSGAQELRSSQLELTLVAIHGLGEWEHLGKAGQESLRHLRECGDHRTRAIVHGHIGVALMRLGSPKAAEEHFRAAIHIAIWDAESRALALPHRRRLAVMFQTLGRWSHSLHESQYAIEEARELGLADQELAALTVSAVVSWKSGRMEEFVFVLDRSSCQGLGNRLQAAALRMDLLSFSPSSNFTPR